MKGQMGSGQALFQAVHSPTSRINAKPPDQLSVRHLALQGRAHGALEPDVQLVHLAFGQGDDPDPQEAHALVNVGDVLLVAGQTVQGLGEDDVDFPRRGVLQELLDAGPDQAGPGDALIGIAPGDLPPLLGGLFGAHAELVVDRGGALQVGGNAGVQSRPLRIIGLVREHAETPFTLHQRA